jgi:DNA polymerase-3 subunit delta
MILKSYEVQKNSFNFIKYSFFLLYGENFGLKKDIKELIKFEAKKKDQNLEILSLNEDEILNNEESFLNSIYSGSLFADKKIIFVNETTDKIISKIINIYEKYPKNILLVISSGILEKRSKLRNFFEKNKNTVCVPCYLDNEKDLEVIAQTELRKNKIILSRETINLLVEKSNSDRNNLKNEIEKIKSYSQNKKKIEFDEIKSLINFHGEHKSDILVNECLCGNINEYKKFVSEIYEGAVNQILLLRILSKKIQRLLIIKEQGGELSNLDSVINSSKPPIFWKEKPLIKKQLSIWNLNDLKKLVNEINNTELLCKKNPHVSKTIFFNFFLKVCKKANNFS